MILCTKFLFTLFSFQLKQSVTESQAKPVNFEKVVMKLSVLKPILICVAILFFYTMSAIDAIIFYAVDIFESTGSSLDSKDSTMILGAVQVVSLPQLDIFHSNYVQLEY
jgi:hypothetical protein